jgi:DUF1680 family protein
MKTILECFLLSILPCLVGNASAEGHTHRWVLKGGNDSYQHELYNAGALCEAAVHYYVSSGKTNLLKVAVKMANLMCDSIGMSPKHEIIPNHAIV